jgi:hypothetical protein
VQVGERSAVADPPAQLWPGEELVDHHRARPDHPGVLAERGPRDP